MKKNLMRTQTMNNEFIDTHQPRTLSLQITFEGKFFLITADGDNGIVIDKFSADSDNIEMGSNRR